MTRARIRESAEHLERRASKGGSLETISPDSQRRKRYRALANAGPFPLRGIAGRLGGHLWLRHVGDLHDRVWSNYQRHRVVLILLAWTYIVVFHAIKAGLGVDDRGSRAPTSPRTGGDALPFHGNIAVAMRDDNRRDPK